MTIYLKIIGGCIIASSFFSCQNQEKQTKSTTTNFPNKDSELALLMRELFDNTEQIKEQIKNNETPNFITKLNKLHTAIPTDSNVREDGLYTAFADDFINAVEAFTVAENKEENYNIMVQKCLACHQQICPGPVKKIKKLRIK